MYVKGYEERSTIEVFRVKEKIMDNNKKILDLKKKIFLTAYRAGAAHLASSFSVIDILYTLYCKGIVDVESEC